VVPRSVCMKTEERLSRIHAPVTRTFASSGGAPLTDGQRRSYREDGYVSNVRVLDREQVEALRARLEDMRSGRNPRLSDVYEIDADYLRAPDRNIFHFLGAWLIDEIFHDVLWHREITVKVAQILESARVRLWHDQVFYKPPRHPGVVVWHQDYSYWTRATPARMVTVHIALDDATPENGCLYYVPRSHRWPLLPKVSLTQDMDAVKKVLTPGQLEAFVPVPVALRAGEASFHHPYLLHGSYGNRSNGPRRSVVLNYMHPETRSADGAHPLMTFMDGSAVPLIPEGKIIDGEYFPLVL
jgi:ectoine hydroxylase-related dioxygenase (phytanoyl-CoA dioxygenase family)